MVVRLASFTAGRLAASPRAAPMAIVLSTVAAAMSLSVGAAGTQGERCSVEASRRCAADLPGVSRLVMGW